MIQVRIKEFQDDEWFPVFTVETDLLIAKAVFESIVHLALRPESMRTGEFFSAEVVYNDAQIHLYVQYPLPPKDGETISPSDLDIAAFFDAEEEPAVQP